MNDEKRRANLHQILDAYIAEHGLRATPERNAILDCVAERRGSFGVADLLAAMEERGFRVSRATVYNALTLFEQVMIVARRLSQTGEAALWEASDQGRVAIALVCTRCGRRRSVRDAALARQLTARRYPSFTPTGVDICVSGICSRCRKQK